MGTPSRNSHARTSMKAPSTSATRSFDARPPPSAIECFLLAAVPSVVALDLRPADPPSDQLIDWLTRATGLVSTDEATDMRPIVDDA